MNIKKIIKQVRVHRNGGQLILGPECLLKYDNQHLNLYTKDELLDIIESGIKTLRLYENQSIDQVKLRKVNYYLFHRANSEDIIKGCFSTEDATSHKIAMNIFNEKGEYNG